MDGVWELRKADLQRVKIEQIKGNEDLMQTG
jgi:hypothetical protein